MPRLTAGRWRFSRAAVTRARRGRGADMAAQCWVQLLGELRVQQGDRAITRFRTQKAGALLAYLAYHLEQRHPRERLIDLLWPWSAPEAGRTNLRTELASLRRQLEGPDVPAGAVIKADRFSVQLDPAVVATDVAQFEAAVQSAERAGSETERRQCLVEAVQVYGGPLLPGYYQEWIPPEQERLADLYFQALRSLTGDLEAGGELEGALEHAWRAVEVEPLREEGHRHLIRLLAAAGQAEAGLRQYQELERILKEELGETPSAATRQLAEQLSGAKAQELALPAEPPRLTTAPRRASRRLPTGTVTFLLTEIEGARDLQRDTGAAFQEALERHQTLLREQFGRHGGSEVTEARGCFTVAFERPSDALDCALACQRALAAQSWPKEVGALRVRMALDTGEVELRDGRYQGPVLDRGRGLLLAAHGGQILCSDVSAGLLQPGLEQAVRLADLGFYRLRDNGGPQRLFAVKYPGMVPETFPAPNAALAYTSNLPHQFTRFFGREGELARLRETVQTEGTRLVTLTGPPGSGKTRLAVEGARQLLEAFHGAVWFVPLQELSEAELIAGAVVEALALPRLPDVEPLDQIVTALSRQPSLLVLDNFEQLVEEGASVVRDLLERVPTLTCLVTSRRSLDLTGESQFLVPPLPTPGGAEIADGLMRCASVQLFVDRAQAARPDFQVTSASAAAVAELCDRLEGVPLALELAAARAQVLTPSQMLAELRHRFEFLVSRKRDVGERHRTLQAAVEWSYGSLSPELQRFFARLSVFRGGWTVEAAQAVCEEPLALDYLEQLRECSLILVDEGGDETGEVRFRMLETLREYGREELAEEETVRRERHAEYYLALAEEAETKPRGEARAAWRRRLEREHDNFRATLAWVKSAEDGAEPGLRLASALWLWRPRWSHVNEGRRHLAEALAREGAMGRTGARAKALYAAGWLAMEQADHRAARPLLEEALAIGRELGDRHRIAACLNAMGKLASARGEYAAAQALYEEALAIAREVGWKGNIAFFLENLRVLAQKRGDHAAAQALHAEALAIAREVGHKSDILRALDGQGWAALWQGDYPTARALLEESLAIHRQLGGKSGIAGALANLAIVVSHQGDYATAQALLEEALVGHRERDDPGEEINVLGRLGRVALYQGDYGRAQVLLEEVLATARSLGQNAVIGVCLGDLGMLARYRGDYAAARALVEEALAMARQLGEKERIAVWLGNLGAVAGDQGDYATAQALLEEALRMHREMGRRPAVAVYLEAFAGVCGGQGQPERAARLLGAAEALREGMGIPLPPCQREGYDRNVAAARAGLDEDTFAAAWAEGRAMTWERAAAYALEEGGD